MESIAGVSMQLKSAKTANYSGDIYIDYREIKFLNRVVNNLAELSFFVCQCTYKKQKWQMRDGWMDILFIDAQP